MKGRGAIYGCCETVARDYKKPTKVRSQTAPKSRDTETGVNGPTKIGDPHYDGSGVQAVYHMALDPVVEIRSDKNSFGFRKHKSTHDAVAYARSHLDKKTAPK